MTNLYYDNAATSFPKPSACASATSLYLREEGGTYGRSFHGRSFSTSQKVEACRESLASLVGIKSCERLCFTFNATTALNTVIRGLSLEEKVVYVSPLEHNAVMRALQSVPQIKVEILPHLEDGLIDVEALKLSSETALVIVNHMSNVNGLIQPIKEIKERLGSIPLLVDAAQSAGSATIYTEAWGLDYLALTGHKSLLGPTGVGALYVKDETKLQPLYYGGTGSRSESFEMPLDLPDRFEAGTPNTVGIIGLLASLQERPKALHYKEDFLELLRKLKALGSYKVFCAKDEQNQGELFSLQSRKMDASELGKKLYQAYGIETRVGLHCSPLAHQSLGSFPEGTVRFAPSPYHTKEDLDFLYSCLKELT